VNAGADAPDLGGERDAGNKAKRLDDRPKWRTMMHMRTSLACSVGWHDWKSLPGEPGGASRRCDRCGMHERVEWVYMGPGTGLGRVRTASPAETADELLVA
jgi:hypothetical protein